MASAQERLAELRGTIPEVGPDEAAELQAKGAVLVDVREPEEVAAGSPPGAARIVRGFLELRIEGAIPDRSATVMLMCAAGSRSLFAASDLLGLGYTDVRSVRGGFGAWKTAGLPVEVPETLAQVERERYGRHLTLPEVGEAGQHRLLASRVVLVGAGGLGSPAALYLAAAGVGELVLVDDDVVERSNLQRQVIHTDLRIGQPKVDSARQTLLALNPTVKVRAVSARLTKDNVDQLFGGEERPNVVVDGADNFPTRYLVNDACVRYGIPNVHGSVYRFEGQVSVFWPAYEKRRGPCYRCVFPEPPPPRLAPSCAEAGVLGVLPGVIGLLEAVETLKILLGVGDPLVGRLVHYEALAQRFTELRIAPDPDCMCAPGREFAGYQDYLGFCSG